MYHVMRERISCPTFETLTEWWKHKSVTIQWRVITHYVVRVVGTLRMLIHLDIIGLYHYFMILYRTIFCAFHYV